MTLYFLPIITKAFQFFLKHWFFDVTENL